MIVPGGPGVSWVQEGSVAEQIHVDWQALRNSAGPFPREAFQFVRDGLAHAVELTHGEGQLGDETDESKHVTGQQLCLGLRDYAIDRYGRLARTVFASWGLRSTDDFGRIVFAMVEVGLMRKTDEDTLEDFQGVYDFDEAFDPAQMA
ncbi:MAG: hypothetical protein IPJ41_10445 [Phycisphaerales bacterium]|nr:hypothetical protein [Phycisphaerales bacterium]